MRPRLPDRVVGIYPADRLFRLIYVQDGKRQSLWLRDEAEALRERRRLEKKLENAHSRTIAEFLEEYLSESVNRGNMTLESSIDLGVRVRLFLKDNLHAEPKSVTPKRAQEIYEAAETEPSKKTGKPLDVASHRYYLAATNRLF